MYFLVDARALLIKATIVQLGINTAVTCLVHCALCGFRYERVMCRQMDRRPHRFRNLAFRASTVLCRQLFRLRFVPRLRLQLNVNCCVVRSLPSLCSLEFRGAFVLVTFFEPWFLRQWFLWSCLCAVGLCNGNWYVCLGCVISSSFWIVYIIVWLLGLGWRFSTYKVTFYFTETFIVSTTDI